LFWGRTSDVSVYYVDMFDFTLSKVQLFHNGSSSEPKVLVGVAGQSAPNLTSSSMEGPGSTIKLTQYAGTISVSSDETSLVFSDKWSRQLVCLVNLLTNDVSVLAGKFSITPYTFADGYWADAQFYVISGLLWEPDKSRVWVTSNSWRELRTISMYNRQVATQFTSSDYGLTDGYLSGSGKLDAAYHFRSRNGLLWLMWSSIYRNIRRLDAEIGYVKFVAGSPGTDRLTGCINGAGTTARFDGSFGGIAWDMDDKAAYIAEPAQNTIRKITFSATGVGTVSEWFGNCPAIWAQPGTGTSDSISFRHIAIVDSEWMYGMTANKAYKINMQTRAPTLLKSLSSSLDIYEWTVLPSQGCRCEAGKELVNGACSACPAGHYCPYGQRISCNPGKQIYNL